MDKEEIPCLTENMSLGKRGRPHNKWDNDASWSSPHMNDYRAD